MGYNTYMCWKCGKDLSYYANSVISRSEGCPACGADIRSCKNCKFYEPGAHYDCHETVDELVQDKERGNFCDYFSLNPKAASKADGASGPSAAEKARSAFDSLFGN